MSGIGRRSSGPTSVSSSAAKSDVTPAARSVVTSAVTKSERRSLGRMCCCTSGRESTKSRAGRCAATVAQTLLATVAAHRPARLFVDSLPDVQQHIRPRDRLSDFVTALVTTLRAAGVTSLFAAELDTLVGPELRLPIPDISAAVDNGILLRYFELESRLCRLVSIIK